MAACVCTMCTESDRPPKWVCGSDMPFLWFLYVVVPPFGEYVLVVYSPSLDAPSLSLAHAVLRAVGQVTCALEDEWGKLETSLVEMSC